MSNITDNNTEFSPMKLFKPPFWGLNCFMGNFYLVSGILTLQIIIGISIIICLIISLCFTDVNNGLFFTIGIVIGFFVSFFGFLVIQKKNSIVYGTFMQDIENQYRSLATKSNDLSIKRQNISNETNQLRIALEERDNSITRLKLEVKTLQEKFVTGKQKIIQLCNEKLSQQYNKCIKYSEQYKLLLQEKVELEKALEEQEQKNNSIQLELEALREDLDTYRQKEGEGNLSYKEKFLQQEQQCKEICEHKAIYQKENLKLKKALEEREERINCIQLEVKTLSKYLDMCRQRESKNIQLYKERLLQQEQQCKEYCEQKAIYQKENLELKKALEEREESINCIQLEVKALSEDLKTCRLRTSKDIELYKEKYLQQEQQCKEICEQKVIYQKENFELKNALESREIIINHIQLEVEALREDLDTIRQKESKDIELYKERFLQQEQQCKEYCEQKAIFQQENLELKKALEEREVSINCIQLEVKALSEDLDTYRQREREGNLSYRERFLQKEQQCNEYLQLIHSLQQNEKALKSRVDSYENQLFLRPHLAESEGDEVQFYEQNKNEKVKTNIDSENQLIESLVKEIITLTEIPISQFREICKKYHFRDFEAIKKINEYVEATYGDDLIENQGKCCIINEEMSEIIRKEILCRQ